MNNNIIADKLIENPLMAYTFKIPFPYTFSLSKYEKESFPAIFGNLLEMSIEDASPKYMLGRVLSFDITPKMLPDPIIIYSPIGDLKPYYRIWKKVMLEGGGVGWFKRNIKLYDKAISCFLQSLSRLENYERLENHEIIFAVIEMLKFKNHIILNTNSRE